MRNGLCPMHSFSSNTNVKVRLAIRNRLAIPLENFVRRHSIVHFEMARRGSPARLRVVQLEVNELARQQAETMDNHPEKLVLRHTSWQIANRFYSMMRPAGWLPISIPAGAAALEILPGERFMSCKNTLSVAPQILLPASGPPSGPAARNSLIIEKKYPKYFGNTKRPTIILTSGRSAAFS